MKKKWLLVYIKANSWKKIVAALNKKKIENYCPLVKRFVRRKFSKANLLLEPLFPSFMFVYISDDEKQAIRQTDGVVNFVYWKENPVVIHKDEIDCIRHFTNLHADIKLMKINVNVTETGGYVDKQGFDFNYDNNTVLVTNTISKLLLPAMGYVLIADSSTPISIQIQHRFLKKMQFVS